MALRVTTVEVNVMESGMTFEASIELMSPMSVHHSGKKTTHLFASRSPNPKQKYQLTILS